MNDKTSSEALADFLQHIRDARAGKLALPTSPAAQPPKPDTTQTSGAPAAAPETERRDKRGHLIADEPQP